MRRDLSKAWAIHDDYRDVDGSRRSYFLGYGFWGWARFPHLSGYVTATFESRALARAEMQRLQAQGHKNLSVRRIQIQIKEIP